MSIATMMDKMHPVVLRKKRFDSLEKSRIFVLGGRFDFKVSDVRNVSQNNIIEWGYVTPKCLIRTWVV